jgi:hypothetical protein
VRGTILCDAVVADNLQASHLRKLGGDTVVHAVGEKRVFFVWTQTFKGHNCNASWRSSLRSNFILPNQYADGYHQREQERRHSSNDRIAPHPSPEMHRRRNRSGDNRTAVQPPLKIVGQFTSRAITGLWIPFQAFRADCFQVAIKCWRQSAQFRSGLFGCLLNCLQRVLTHERRPTS